MYVWLLSFERPNVGRRLLSTVPFFYWRVGAGSSTASNHAPAPLLDLISPEHPVITSVGRELLQRFLFDGLITPVRASTHAYRTNALDHERLHLEEAVSYLREAPPTDDAVGLTRLQIETLIARLELRKNLLGGLVGERRAADLGKESLFAYERVRARNWELLRQWADKTGLYFEPLNLAGTAGQYAILWYAPSVPTKPLVSNLEPIWKLLNVTDPSEDDRFRSWSGIVEERWVDHDGILQAAGSKGAHPVKMFPLSAYSLDYPRQPLLLIDFRNMLHVRRHEMTQRTITELTSGVIGLSHFTNWYYYAGAAFYDLVVSRKGAAMNQAQRLDSYSQFRVRLALDKQLDPALRAEMQRRVDSLAVNPLEVSPKRELQAASARYLELEREAGDEGNLVARLDKNRRKELALVVESRTQRMRDNLLHGLSLGAYTHRVTPSQENFAKLSDYRRLQYELNFLGTITESGTRPEVAINGERIRSAVADVRQLLAKTESRPLRARATLTLARLRDLSQDAALQADCSAAVAMLEVPNSRATRIALKPAAISRDLGNLSARNGADPLE
jgi:hypothetical protein